MIKNVKVFFAVLCVISFISFSFIGKDTPTEGLMIGDRAPEFKISSEKQLVELKSLRGKYVLLSFWASYNAESRMKNAMLNHVVSKIENIEMISVSFDEYKSIFNETIEKDQITNPNCFVELDGVHSDIYKEYRLDKGFKNYLLDEKGIIVAKNVGVSEILSLMN